MPWRLVVARATASRHCIGLGGGLHPLGFIRPPNLCANCIAARLSGRCARGFSFDTSKGPLLTTAFARLGQDARGQRGETGGCAQFETDRADLCRQRRCGRCAGRRPRAARRRLRGAVPRQGPLPERLAARQGQPRAGLGQAPSARSRRSSSTDDGQAEVTLRDRRATSRRCAAGTLVTVRQASLSGVANRYLDLRLPPQAQRRRSPTAASIEQDDDDHGGRPRPALQHASTTPTRAGALRASSAARRRQYAGRGDAYGEGLLYLNPSLSASSRLFRELNRDTPLLERFIVSSSQARHRRRRPPRRPRRPGRQPRARPRRAIGDEQAALAEAIEPAAGLHAPRQHDLREPARRARRPRPAGRGLQAGRQEAAARSSPSCARSPATRARRCATSRDLIKRTRRRQRPGRAHAGRRCRSRTIAVGAVSDNGKQREGALPGLDQGAQERDARARVRPPVRRPTCSAGSTTSATPASTTRSAASPAPAPHANAFTFVNGQLRADPAGAARAGVQRHRGAATSATAARARPSTRADDGSDPYKPTPDFNCDATQVLPGRMKRALARHPRPGRRAVAVARHRRRGRRRRRGAAATRSSSTTPSASSRARDLKVAGVRAGHDHRPAARPQDHATRSSTSRSPRPASASLRTDAFCETRPQSLIGEYFIDCRPGTAAQKLAARRAHPGRADRLDRSRPTSSTTSCAAPTASGCGSSSTSSASASRAAARTSTRRSAAPARRCARPTACWRSSAARTQTLRRPRRRTPTRSRRPRRQPRGRRPLGRARRARPPPPPPSAATRSPQACARLPAFLRELRPTMAELGRAADAQTPTLRDLDASAGPARDALHAASSPFARRRRSVNLRSLGEAARRSAARPSRRAAPGRRRARPLLRRTTPELAQNLRHRPRATSTTATARSRRTRARPGGKGYTGFEALLQYVYDQAMAINIFDAQRLHPQGQPVRERVLGVPERRVAEGAARPSDPRLLRALRVRPRARTSPASCSPTRPSPSQRRASATRQARRRQRPPRADTQAAAPATRGAATGAAASRRSTSATTARRAARRQAASRRVLGPRRRSTAARGAAGARQRRCRRRPTRRPPRLPLRLMRRAALQRRPREPRPRRRGHACS